MLIFFSIYNLLLSLFGILLLPAFLLIILTRKKYRGRTLERLGLRNRKIKEIQKIQESLTEGVQDSTREGPKTPVIWMHALSVGEVTSALPLVKALRTEREEALLILTVATSSGKKIAENLLSPYVQCILSSPFDLRFAVQRYIQAICPDLFIQVETDFWPNWLFLFQKNKIPAMLVNGRVSEKSFAAYQRFAFFFRPMFCLFDLLSMQTHEDCQKMTQLGVPADKVIALGNLKYDMDQPDEQEKRDSPVLLGKEECFFWVCGSTHPEEEKIIFSAVAQFLARQEQQKSPEDLFLVVAPRNINRGQELVDLACSFGLQAGLRSHDKEADGYKAYKAYKGRVLILDTLGELARCYGQADLAFVGGSLVKQGGHNPIEPAIHGVPVLFGPHMEDFSEIAQELLDCGGGKTVTADSLLEILTSLCINKERRAVMGQAANALVTSHRGGVQRHVQAILELLRH
ncbi:MAG: 3-deoxy-D-manno-octulosonic acid transferase [Candidatus Electrothrix sp. MAN1_4]|nr:3-deoxy-D-manno-octulosonic acid transferase [Candidatus Electrothrix sp. MAN1_4]